ncbi:MAG: response regulator [Pseudomonadota bacterium]
MPVPGSGCKKLILIVDDEEATRDSCFQVLAKAGYRVLTASNGDTGLAEVRRCHPDLVLIDLNMPGVSGLEVIDLLNRMEPKIQKVVITGSTAIDLDKEVISKGRASAYLKKPFIPDELKSIVKRVLKEKETDYGS